MWVRGLVVNVRVFYVTTREKDIHARIFCVHVCERELKYES